MILLGVEIKEKKLNCRCCVNEKVDKSIQICLITFGENSSRRMRKIRSGSCIVIVFLDVD